MKKLAIFVNSFDGYSDLWGIFFKIFDTYFKNNTFPIYLSTNYMDFSHENLTIIKTGEEKCWYTRTKEAVSKIPEDYILFMLEDYLIGQDVITSQIQEIIKYMEDNKIDYYRLEDTPKSEGIYKEIEYLGNINRKQKYGINTIVSIWNKDFLIKILDEAINVKSAWDFEVYLCDKFTGIDEGYIPNCCVDRRNILKIQNGVYRGKWFRTTINYFKKRNININICDRELLSKKENFFFYCRSFIEKHLSISGKEKVKKILRKFNFEFLSDGK